MERVFIGIDPSINSTGVCTLLCDEQAGTCKEHFFIIKPSYKKLTKKEVKAQESNLNFDYLIYDSVDLSEYNDNNHLHEFYKTTNMISAVNMIYAIISNVELIGWKPGTEIFVVIEGISYGSTLRTKSVFDLAGLNYMIRQKFIDKSVFITIATPSEIKKYATGNGNCNKDAIITLFAASHPKINVPKMDDIADAYFMAKYARKKYMSINI